MVLNNSEFFPTLLKEDVDFTKNYNVEIPPIGGSVNSILQADKLLENFQFSDTNEAGAIVNQSSIDNFLIYGQQGYLIPMTETTPTQGDGDFLTGIEQQGTDTSSLDQKIADYGSDESDWLQAGVGNAFTKVPPPVTNPLLRSVPATINVTYNGVPTQAQAAFDYAVNIWKNLIYSPVSINIQVGWAASGSGNLGSGGPSAYQQNFANAPQPNTLYPIGLANSLAGSDLDTTKPDITVNFNSSRADWYFGTDRNTPSNQFDFVSVALHEIAHGLGFTGQIQSNSGVGQWGSLPAIYDRFTVNGSGQSLIDTSLFPNPSTALGSQLTSNSLLFNGTNTRNANGNNNPRLFAPNPWNSGSSYYHLDESAYPAGNINSLMTPTLNTAEAIHNPGPVTLGILKDMGWDVNTSPSFNRVKTFRDFDGNGKADILWRDPVVGNNSVWLMNGTAPTGATGGFQLGPSWQAQGTGDFDGNGKADILWRDPVTGWNSVWLMNGTAPTGATGVFQVGTSWQVQGTGDFDGDGKADILWRDPVTGWNSVWLMNGTAPTGATGVFQVGTSWQVQGTGDFDGDGKADILWRDPVTGWNSVWLMNGTAPTGATGVFQVGTNWQTKGIGDFDGNGKADILWRDPVTGWNSVWLMNGTAPTGATGTFQLGTGWQVQGTGDFDGNGKADILWRDPVTGNNSVWLMNGTAPTGATGGFQLGTTWEAIG